MPRVSLPDSKPRNGIPIREDTFVVESILGDRTIFRKQKFYVKWSGYSDEHNSWEPQSSLEFCDDKIQKWFQTASEQINQHFEKRQQELELANAQKQQQKQQQGENKPSILKRESKFAKVSGAILNPKKVVCYMCIKSVQQEVTFIEPYAMKLHGLKLENDQLKYFVQWHGRSPMDSTWESYDKIPNYVEVLKFWIQDGFAKNYNIVAKQEFLQKQEEVVRIGKQSRRSFILVQAEMIDHEQNDEYGSFTYYDVPERILAGRTLMNYFQQKEVLIRWMPRDNGIRPKDSWMEYEQTKIRAQYAVIDYFEKYSQCRVLFEEAIEVIPRNDFDCE